MRSGYVQTRALDGNEVALAVTVSYKIRTEPAALRRLIQKVALTNQRVENIVVAAARADIRTFMNELKTDIRNDPTVSSLEIKEHVHTK